MQTVRRALALGLAFGLAAATVEAWGNLIPFIQRRFGPGPGFVLQVAAFEIFLGLLLGLAAAPLLRLRFGRVLHLVAMALAWYGLERWVPLDSPLFRASEILPPVGGFVLTLLGFGLARLAKPAPWALGVLLLFVGAGAPGVYLAATAPEPLAPVKHGAARPGAPDVVLVVLDTVRARNLSTYGYARPTAPEIDALAKEGALFLDATSPSTWSLPSHASLFTGRYPSSHGAHGEHVYLDSRYPTIAQALAGAGYETYCFTSNAWISDGLGLTRGFDVQDASWKSGAGPGRGFSFVHRLLDRLGLLESDKGGAVVAENFAAWTRERPKGGRPTFAFLNFIEAHFPYHQLPHDALRMYAKEPYSYLRRLSLDLMAIQFGGPGRPVEEARGPAVDMYDGGVVYTSRLLGRVIDALRERGTLDDTIVVVLADHGELLGERGGFFGHGPTLYQEAVGVPLLVRYPARIPAGARVAQPVSTVGVFATILDLAGLPAIPTAQVGSLAPLANGAVDGGGPVLSELQKMEELGGDSFSRPDPQMHGGSRLRMLRDGSWKLVETSKGERFLFDLAADPGETRDLAAERPADLARVAKRMVATVAELGLPPLDGAAGTTGDEPAELDPATKERLRALGYVE
jgi:arylsulfatase A-like enzyme